MNFPDVSSREEFANFVRSLIKNYEDEIQEWENLSVPEFLEALNAWAADKDIHASSDAWKIMAQLLYAGSRYE